MKTKTDSHLCSMDTFGIHRNKNLSSSQLDGRKSSSSRTQTHYRYIEISHDLYRFYVLTPENAAFILA